MASELDPIPSLNDIQREHENLLNVFQAIEELKGAELPPEVNKSQLLNLLQTLVTTLSEHFQTEERFMGSFDYPQLHGHKWQHEVLLEHVQALQKEIENGTKVSPARLVSELRHLVVDHTHMTDSDFIAHYIVFSQGGEDLGVPEDVSRLQ
jgi:hemerythrin-like metal-binding protein